MEGLRGSGSQLRLQEGSADSQAALTPTSFLMELWVLGAAFINQIRARAHSLRVKASQRKKKARTSGSSQFGRCADSVEKLSGLVQTFVQSCSSSMDTFFFFCESDMKYELLEGARFSPNWSPSFPVLFIILYIYYFFSILSNLCFRAAS